MDLDQFIEFFIEEGEINAEVLKKSLEVNEFPLTRKILLKIEGQTTLLENILRPKNEGELVYSKGELLRICILNDQDIKQQGIKFIDDLIKKVREKFNLHSSEKRVIKNKNLDKPTSKVSETIQEVEADLSSLIQKANQFFDLEDYSKAIYFYNQAINLNDDNYILFYNRGLAHQYLDQFENAIKDFDYALHLFDGENKIGSNIYFSLGKCYWYLDTYEEAIKSFDNAINLNKNDELFFYYRGLCYYELDENEEAIDNFDRAIDLNPNDDRYFYYRSKAKLDSTKIYKINEIIEDLNKSVSLLDDSSFKEQVLFDRALLFKEKGEYEKCLKDLSYLIKKSAELKYLKERIFIYLDLYKYEKAIKDILECCELDPENSLEYKGYLINIRSPNPYNGYNLKIELEIVEGQTKTKLGNTEVRGFVDSGYRDRIINLFGIDGVEEFRKAVKLLPWQSD